MTKTYILNPPAYVEQQKLSWEEYVSQGIIARESKDNSQWLLGDLALGVKKDYGEDSIGKYATEISVAKNSLKVYRNVASTFEKDMRIFFSRLSFTHFQLCAGQDDPEKWLKLADDNNWTCEQLAIEIKKTKPVKENDWLRIYDLWNFNKPDVRFGIKHPGQIPGQIVANILHYYTKEDDLVVDPFGGGGSTLDVCKYMKRRCLIYDVAPVRKEIKKHDIRNGFPTSAEGCDLIFLDPPYWSMLDEKYVKESVSSLSYDDFIIFLNELAINCFKNLKLGGYLSFIIQNQTEKDLNGKPYIDWCFIAYEIFKNNFLPIRRINCPQSTETFLPQQVEKAKSEKRMLGIVRDLVIFQKLKE